MKGQHRVLRILMAALFCAFFAAFAGISGAQEEEAPAPAEQAADPSSDLSDVRQALEDESFRYQSSGKRDPFKSLLTLQEKKKDLSLLPPIQRIDLNNITISGVIMDDVEGPRAMIKAPNKQTFVVKKGMIIGKNEGEVIEVSLQGIRVVERFIDFMGEETLKETFIKTRKAKKN